jgi:uncharacterized protein YegL
MIRALLACLIVLAPQQLFRTGVEVVSVDVSVMRGGQPVRGLTAADFLLTDNAVAQDVATVGLEQLPLSVTIVLDVSDSVLGNRLASLVQAGTALTQALRQGDRASLITFSHHVDLRVPMTGALPTVRGALTRLSGAGATSLRDAVQMGIQLAPQNDETRPLVLLFTDGHDTSSFATEDDVLELARRSGIVTHVVQVESDAFLERLVVTTGGRHWSATSDRQLRELFTNALQEMRARYLLTYTPRGVARPGWHELKVRLKNARADITARPGYFAGAPRPPSD